MTIKTVAERESFARLYEAHARGARRLAYLLTGDGATADDLVQEAFTRLYARVVHLRRPEAFPAYLRRTVINLARMHFRRGAVESRYRIRREQALAPQVVEEFERLDDLSRLQAALMGLSYRQRTAVVARFYLDLPDAETAESLGCTESTVRSLVARGLAELRRQLEESHV